MSQGCDTPKTQIPKLKPETIRNQNYPKPQTQMFLMSFGIGTYLISFVERDRGTVKISNYETKNGRFPQKQVISTNLS